MNLRFTDYINDRLDEISTDLRKTNGEYAVAVEMRNELYELFEPIIMSKKDLELCVGDFQNFQDYIKHSFTIVAIEQRAFYQQGYLDCVKLLQTLGML